MTQAESCDTYAFSNFYHLILSACHEPLLDARDDFKQFVEYTKLLALSEESGKTQSQQSYQRSGVKY